MIWHGFQYGKGGSLIQSGTQNGVDGREGFLDWACLPSMLSRIRGSADEILDSLLSMLQPPNYSDQITNFHNNLFKLEVPNILNLGSRTMWTQRNAWTYARNLSDQFLTPSNATCISLKRREMDVLNTFNFAKGIPTRPLTSLPHVGWFSPPSLFGEEE